MEKRVIVLLSLCPMNRTQPTPLKKFFHILTYPLLRKNNVLNTARQPPTLPRPMPLAVGLPPYCITAAPTPQATTYISLRELPWQISPFSLAAKSFMARAISPVMGSSMVAISRGPFNQVHDQDSLWLEIVIVKATRHFAVAGG